MPERTVIQPAISFRCETRLATGLKEWAKKGRASPKSENSDCVGGFRKEPKTWHRKPSRPNDKGNDPSEIRGAHCPCEGMPERTVIQPAISFRCETRWRA